MKNILFLIIIMTCSKSQIYAQLSNVQLVLSAQDSSIEHGYGLFNVIVNSTGLDDTTRILRAWDLNHVWVKFPGLDWMDYDYRRQYSSHHPTHVQWVSNSSLDYIIDLTIFYFNNPIFIDSFMSTGGTIQIKFSTTFKNITSDSIRPMTTNILSFNIPPANTEELQAFKYLLSQEKTFSGTHLEDIFFPEIDLSTFSSEKHYKYLIEHFPNTLVGTMAKCRLAILLCSYHSHLTTIPPAIKQQINEFYQTLKAHPSKYIRRQAEVLIKCHD
jgi:hypothetical protein